MGIKEGALYLGCKYVTKLIITEPEDFDFKDLEAKVGDAIGGAAVVRVGGETTITIEQDGKDIDAMYDEHKLKHVKRMQTYKGEEPLILKTAAELVTEGVMTTLGDSIPAEGVKVQTFRVEEQPPPPKPEFDKTRPAPLE